MGQVRKAKDHLIHKWGETFQIDINSPSGLSWKVNGNNKSIGKPVGYLTKLNYWKCELENKSIFVHRIIYFLTNGILDNEKVIDHIDGNPLNNDPINLRQITCAENCRNKRQAINNKTGITGIHENHDIVVTWSENGKAKSKKFSALKLGTEEAKRLALEYRELKIKELNNIGYNYSDRHGKTCM